MAGESLAYLGALAGEFPDNIAGLIQPVNSRNAVYSLAPGVALARSTTTSTVNVASGSAVDIGGSMSGLTLDAARGWQLASGVLSYVGDAGVTVPAGFTSLVVATCAVEFVKSAAGSGDYTLEITLGGTPITASAARELSVGPTDTVAATFTAAFPYSRSSAPAVGAAVTGEGTSDDIDVQSFTLWVVDYLLGAAP